MKTSLFRYFILVYEYKILLEKSLFHLFNWILMQIKVKLLPHDWR